jgi:U3 small nucleolar RNA-associated protein 12
LETQHCIQTIVGHRSEVWTFDINAQETRLVSGSVDTKLRVWCLDKEEFSSIPDQEKEIILDSVHIESSDQQKTLSMGLPDPSDMEIEELEVRTTFFV